MKSENVAKGYNIIKSIVLHEWKTYKITGAAIRKIIGGCPRDDYVRCSICFPKRKKMCDMQLLMQNNYN